MKMSHRFFISAGTLAIRIAFLSAAFVPVTGQAQTSGAATWTPPKATYSPPRTPWGDPDLQGVWDYQSRIPMQRPAQFKDKPTLTEAELAQLAKTPPNQDSCGVGTRQDVACTPEQLADIGAYNEFWNNRNFLADNRTSLIVDPPDGRLPPMMPEAQKRQAEIQKTIGTFDRQRYDSWEDFPTVTRCIAEHTPNGPQGYNSGTLITQSPGWIVMFRERLDTRIIPLDKRPHIDDHIRQWNGDSRGWFEGNTRLVEQKASEAAAKGALSSDPTSGGLIGATEAAIRSKLGEPKAVDYNGTRWTYETADGVSVLYLFFAEGKVKIATPNDLPLNAVKRR